MPSTEKSVFKVWRVPPDKWSCQRNEKYGKADDINRKKAIPSWPTSVSIYYIKRMHGKIYIVFFYFYRRAERKKYYKHIKKSLKRPDKYLSIIIDGMDQAKTAIPHWVQSSKVEYNNFKKWKIILLIHILMSCISWTEYRLKETMNSSWKHMWLGYFAMVLTYPCVFWTCCDGHKTAMWPLLA